MTAVLDTNIVICFIRQTLIPARSEFPKGNCPDAPTTYRA